MSASRPIFLPFLYPILFKPSTYTSNAVRRASIARPRPRRKPRRQIAQFSTTRTVTVEARPRYGAANEPSPDLKDREEAVAQETAGTETTEKVVAKLESKSQEAQQEHEAEEEEEEHETPSKPPDPDVKFNEANPPNLDNPTTPPPNAPNVPDSQPLETVLHMPSPSESSDKPPHLTAPPYVHHFDTYSLVKDLESSGFSQHQSVTIMKSVRALLTDNMEIARQGLVSKSNVENETYLFRAACSELRTEIQNNRRAEMEKLRTERTQLQHEVDILGQRFNQDSQVMKDELKGLFDDRKMSVRMEQRKMDGQIQYLNGKITVALNSDARSEVEGLRWILTRRAAMALGICAILILSTLRYNSYMTQTQAAERKALEEKLKRDFDNGDSHEQGSGGSESKVGKPVEEAGGEGLIASEGGGRGFVSLG